MICPGSRAWNKELGCSYLGRFGPNPRALNPKTSIDAFTCHSLTFVGHSLLGRPNGTRTFPAAAGSRFSSSHFWVSLGCLTRHPWIGLSSSCLCISLGCVTRHPWIRLSSSCFGVSLGRLTCCPEQCSMLSDSTDARSGYSLLFSAILMVLIASQLACADTGNLVWWSSL
jgi:hypothetical protein